MIDQKRVSEMLGYDGERAHRPPPVGRLGFWAVTARTRPRQRYPLEPAGQWAKNLQYYGGSVCRVSGGGSRVEPARSP